VIWLPVNMGMAKGSMTLDANQFFNALKQVVSALGDLEGSSQEASSAVDGVETSLQGVGSDLSGIGKAQSELEETAAKSTKLGENLEGTGDKGKEAGKTIKDTFDKIGATLDTVGGKVIAVGDKLQTAGKKMSSVGGTLTRNLTLPIAAVGGYSVKTAADFEKGMSNVQAISGATAEELELLSAKAQEMGATTKFTATEATDALSYMAMAGWKTNDMLSGLDGIMNLAAASGEDLASTSDIVTDAITAFGLSAEDSSHFADVLASASSNANTNVSMLGESFKYVAPVAGSLGYSVEDTAIALGLMANSGIKASQAGTSLRSALTSIISPTEEAQKELEKMGVSLTNQDGSVKSLKEVMDDLRSAMSGMSEAQQTQVANLIFGDRAMTGMLAIVNSSEADYNKLTDAIYNAEGAAKTMADIQLDNFSGQLTLLKSQAEGVAIQIGQELVPALSGLLDKISEGLEWFSQLDDDTKELIINGALLVAVIGPVLKIFGTLTTVIGGTVKAVGNIITAFGWLAPKVGSALAALSPVVLDGLAVVGAAIAGWEIGSLIYDTWGPQIEEFLFPIFDFFVELWDNIVNFFTESIPEFFVTLGETISAGWNAIVEFFVGVWESIKNFFVTIATYIWDSFLGPIVEAVTATVQKIYEIVAKIFEIIWALLSTAGNLIWDYVINPIWDGIKWLADVIGGAFSDLWDGIVGIFEGAWNWVDETIITPIWDSISSIADDIASVFSDLWDSITEVFEDVADWFGEIFTKAWEAITLVFTGAGRWFSGIWEDIKDVFSDAAIAVGEFFSGAFTSVFNWIMEGVEDVVNFFVDGVNGVIDIINAIPGVEISALDRLELPRLAVGLDYVPYDGYVAQLHQGERVMTKQENEEYTNRNSDMQGGNTFNFYSPEPIDEVTAAEEFKRVEKELAEGV